MASFTQSLMSIWTERCENIRLPMRDLLTAWSTFSIRVPCQLWSCREYCTCWHFSTSHGTEAEHQRATLRALMKSITPHVLWEDNVNFILSLTSLCVPAGQNVITSSVDWLLQPVEVRARPPGCRDQLKLGSVQSWVVNICHLHSTWFEELLQDCSSNFYNELVRQTPRKGSRHLPNIRRRQFWEYGAGEWRGSPSILIADD